MNRQESRLSQKKSRGRKKQDQSNNFRKKPYFLGAFAALVVAALVGAWLLASDDSQTPTRKEDLLLSGSYHQKLDIPVSFVPYNENKRQEVLARATSFQVNKTFSPVHIFKQDEGSSAIRWIASGTLHEPTGLIATVEHAFPASEPKGYFSYCKVSEPLPKKEEDVKYIEAFLPLPVFKIDDVAVARPGRKALIQGTSTYTQQLYRFKDFMIQGFGDKAFPITSLVSGKPSPVKGGLALLEEVNPKTSQVTNNRFVAVLEESIILGQSGEGYFTQIGGEDALFVQSGYYEYLPDDLKGNIQQALGIVGESEFYVCILYSFPAKIFDTQSPRE